MNNLTFQVYEANLFEESFNKGDSPLVSPLQSSYAGSTNFSSVDASGSAPDSDTSNLRRLIENDTFLKNVSKNDSENFLNVGYSRLKNSPNCKSSPKPQTMDTSTASSTNHQFLGLSYCLNKRGSKSPDSGCLQSLMTSLEEATDPNKTNPKTISGLQLMRLIETTKFQETLINLGNDLVKSSKEITVNQLAQVLVEMLQTDSSCSNSFFNSTTILKLSEKKIEDESSLSDLYFDFSHSSPTISSKTPEKSFEVKTEEGSSGETRKEQTKIPLFANIESNKQNPILQIIKKEIVSPKKNKNRFSSKVWQYPSFKKIIFKPQKKKYVASPRFKQNEYNEKDIVNSTTDSEALFLHLEQNLVLEEKESQNNLRRSVLMDSILKEESTTSEDFKLIKDNPEITKNKKLPEKTSQCSDNKSEERSKKSARQRIKSVENISHREQKNFVSKNAFPSIKRKKFLGQKNNFSSPKPTVKIGLTSSTKSPMLAKIQHWGRKHCSNWKSPRKSSNSNKSIVIDSSSLRPVSLTRQLFSPAAKAQGFPRGIPPIKITESSKVSLHSTPKDLNHEKISQSKSAKNNSPKKPWR
ncbi:uncharacterized protein LOC117172084 [Belonocnema kinseyi]|uniref:uncharacterized protein LOC117172084 n=1 Tax=Belonocnema kinseyi TaxID=2817044 RepID=UPI00143DB284|nr:uncharacterized protein LOC117172084 [Belonocnema kinseyi]